MRTLTIRDVVNGDTGTNAKTVTQAIMFRIKWSDADVTTPGQFAVWSSSDSYTPGQQVYLKG